MKGHDTVPSNSLPNRVWPLPAVLVLCTLAGFPNAQGQVTMVTHGPPDMSLPRHTTDDQPARYGIGLPFQVSATGAALFCNLRTIGHGRGDYEDGTDVFVFDDLSAIAHTEAAEISRNEKTIDPKTGKPRVVVKFPVVGGFWPLGARAVDGSRHPGEGKGFGICQALSFVVDGEGLFTWKATFIRYVEELKFSFDGRCFKVVERKRTGPEPLPRTAVDGWAIVAPGLTNAIPDGDDLLLPLLGRKGARQMCGVCRWRFQGGRWAAESFVPVGFGSEPSLVRAADGSLLFSSRLGGKDGSTVVAWRSFGWAQPWHDVLRKANVRTSSPVSINRTADGIPFVAANPRGTHRATLCFWTLDGRDLSERRLIRDCHQEFGPPPDGTFWAADHVSSATVRLADGKWHALLAYRLLAFPTRGRAEPVVAQTGCYVEEVLSPGEPRPEWRFAEASNRR